MEPRFAGLYENNDSANRSASTKGSSFTAPTAWTTKEKDGPEKDAPSKKRDKFDYKANKKEKKLQSAQRLLSGFGYDQRISGLLSNYIRSKQNIELINNEKKALSHSNQQSGPIGSKQSILAHSYESQLHKVRNLTKKIIDTAYWDRANAKLEPLNIFKVESSKVIANDASKDKIEDSLDIKINDKLVKDYLEYLQDQLNNDNDLPNANDKKRKLVDDSINLEISNLINDNYESAESSKPFKLTKVNSSNIEDNVNQVQFEIERTLYPSNNLPPMSVPIMSQTDNSDINTNLVDIVIKKTKQKEASLLEDNNTNNHVIGNLPPKMNLSFINIPKDEPLANAEHGLFNKLKTLKTIKHNSSIKVYESKNIFYQALYGKDSPKASNKMFFKNRK